MASATITSKGQITLPKEVRHALGIEKGDRIEFVRNQSSGRYELVAATGSVRELKGIVQKPAKPVSIEEMNAVIAQQGGR